MTTLNFRLPANRSDLSSRPPRRAASLPRLPLERAFGQPVQPVKKMDAEVAALIALRHLGARELQLQALDAGADEAEIGSSGWFNSTWELANGLDIAEGLPTDLPLDGWLQFYLAA